tara:strand:+ start:85 stop:423 length:339 start_codon:yes stop_codon:yes gene_type:complete
MKKFTFLLLFIPLLSYSQTKEKNARDSFEVRGNCEMCKKRIESATLSLKGVKYVSWSPKSKNFSIIYNNTKVSIDDVKKRIADVGHDNSLYKASDEAYENLHFCCKYRDNPE